MCGAANSPDYRSHYVQKGVFHSPEWGHIVGDLRHPGDMMTVVLTVDQRRSRRCPDAVGTAIRAAAENPSWQVMRPLERTAGDEMQCVVTHPATVVEMATLLADSGVWSVGVGVGEAQTPLPESTREGAGAAFIAAREAVDAAKRHPQRLRVCATGTRDAAEPAQVLESLLHARLFVRAGRSDEGREAVAMAGEMTGKQIAVRLGVSPQAISQRLQVAGWRVEQGLQTAAVAMAGTMLLIGQQAGNDQGDGVGHGNARTGTGRYLGGTQSRAEQSGDGRHQPEAEPHGDAGSHGSGPTGSGAAGMSGAGPDVRDVTDPAEMVGR